MGLAKDEAEFFARLGTARTALLDAEKLFEEINATGKKFDFTTCNDVGLVLSVSMLASRLDKKWRAPFNRAMAESPDGYASN